jgi:predicted nucleic acid-binding protein
LIYWLEDKPEANLYTAFFEALRAKRVFAIATPVTLAELLVQPLRAGRFDLADRYERLLTAGAGWSLRATDAEIAALAARYRAKHRLRLPEALQLATAVLERCDALLTHDIDFPESAGVAIWRAGPPG